MGQKRKCPKADVRTMKAIIVTPYYYPKIGGLENYARQLGIALKDIKKWEIVIVTSGDPKTGVTQEVVDGMKTYRLARWFKLSNTPINLLWPMQIRKIIKQEKPDLIVAHTPVPSMSDSAAIAAGRTPFVLIYHAATLLKDGLFIFNVIARVYRLMELISFMKAKRIIVVSDYVKEQLPTRIQNKVSVVPNSVWANEITIRGEQPRSSKFLFIGSLDKTHGWKGLDQIIKAVSIYKQSYTDSVQLLVMGEGDKLPEYRTMVRELNLENSVKFLGTKGGKEKDAIINDATAIIVYPTTSNDAFPTVILEAWAKGVPVISAKIGAITSLVDNYKTGYLVEASNPQALSEKMNEVTKSNTASRQAIAKASEISAVKNYTWERQAEVFSSLAKGLV